MSSAISRPVPARGLDEPIEIVEGAEPRLDRHVAAGLRADRPRAAGIVRFRPRASCCGPLRKLRPIGWIGGRYSTSKPIAATYGRGAAASSNVALRWDRCPAERGNISYHAPNRARSRSTVTPSTRSYRVARLADRAPPPSHRQARRSAAATRSPIGARGSPSNCRSPGELRRVSWPRRRLAKSFAPSSSSLATSCPAPTFLLRVHAARSRSDRSSLRPCTRRCRANRRRTCACQRSFASGAIGVSRHVARRPPRRYSNTAASTSCPSANTSALHDHASPNRPLDRKAPAVHLRTHVLDHHAALKRRIKTAAWQRS